MFSVSCYLSTMIDKKNNLRGPGIRNLTAEFLAALDVRYTEMRKGTRYENVRQFDGRVFVAATREGLTESEIARSFSVTRQAVHASVERLIALKLLERQPIPGNRRDKRIALTERGIHASQTAQSQIAEVEAECAAIIGAENFNTFRLQLELVSNTLKQRTKLKPPV
jgi:DNA-binding MarR family transcriptional regulator